MTYGLMIEIKEKVGLYIKLVHYFISVTYLSASNHLVDELRFLVQCLARPCQVLYYGKCLTAFDKPPISY